MAESTVSPGQSNFLGAASDMVGIIGWPVAFLIFAIVFLLAFRGSIGRLIDRSTSITTSGVTAAPISPIQPVAVDEAKKDAPNINTDYLKEFPVATAAHKALIEKDVEKVSPADIKRYMVEHMAHLRTLYIFENAFAYIYGGQIKLLKFLNDRQSLGVSDSEVQNLWDAHKQSLFPLLETWNLDIYINYLVMNGLAVREHNKLKITAVGVEFLMWMIKNGRSESQRAY